MSDEAGGYDRDFDAAQCRNDDTRHLDEPTHAEEMGKLMRLQTALACDWMTPEDRKMIAREVFRLQLVLSLKLAA